MLPAILFLLSLTHNIEHIAGALNSKPECTDSEPRLMNGRTSCDGRVELCQGGEWKAVCDVGWEKREAELLCQHLTLLSEDAQPIKRGYFGTTNGTNYVGVMCSNSPHQQFTDCNTAPLNTDSDCMAAGVICQPNLGRSCSPRMNQIHTVIVSITETAKVFIQCTSTIPATSKCKIRQTVSVTVETCIATSSVPMIVSTIHVTDSVSYCPTSTMERSSTSIPDSSPTPTMDSSSTSILYISHTTILGSSSPTSVMDSSHISILSTSPTPVMDSSHISILDNSPIPCRCSDSSKSSQQTLNMGCTQNQSAQAAVGGLGAFVAVQFLALLGVITGWICTCVLIKRKKSGKYPVTREHQLHNPTYFESHPGAETQPANHTTSAQYSVLGPSYELLNTATQNTSDDSHTYDVIPVTVNHSKAKKKQVSRSVVSQRRSVSDDAPAIPPRKVSACVTSDSQRPSTGPTESSSPEPKEHFYHVLEKPVPKSDRYMLTEHVEDTRSDSQGMHHILGEGDSHQHMLGRISWCEDDEKSNMEDSKLQISPSCSENWEERSPTSYEVPVTLRNKKFVM